MRGVGIFNQDLAVADRNLMPGNGSVVVAVVESTMSEKSLVIEGKVPHLALSNPDLQAFAVEDLIGSISGV